MDQVSIKYVYQHLPLQDLSKFTQIWIFGSKTNHLATLYGTHQKAHIKDAVKSDFPYICMYILTLYVILFSFFYY
jgi:hypothetical protein